ncbi:hypothetical protein ACFWP0_03570 [Achromobacter sp. NPDC058515]|uniref:hypothetical protein n=1 Tax=Achromobacter sp. NPDC058515 TaxID=3346533 RepID=UPI00365E998C
MSRPYIAMIYGEYILFLFVVRDNDFARRRAAQGGRFPLFFAGRGARRPYFFLFSVPMSGIVFSHDKPVAWCDLANGYERWNMRYLYIVLIVLLTAIVLSFKIQNFDSVTLSLWTSTVTLPASVLVIGVYILGMFTGGFLLSLLRSAFRGAANRPAP